MYNSTYPGIKTVIPRVDTAPHGVETPTQGTPSLIVFREAIRPHPMNGRKEFSKFMNCQQIMYGLSLIHI